MSQDKSTKEKILAAAKELFLAHGFAGASMGEIGRQAAVNHSLLFYHFKNKENLWKEVKLYIASKDEDAWASMPSASLKFSDFIRELFVSSIDFFKKSPEFVRMLNWQRAESGEHKGIGASLSSMKRLINILQLYQKNGDIRRDIRLEFITSMIISITSSIALDNYDFLSDQKNLDEYIDFAAKAVVNAVR